MTFMSVLAVFGVNGASNKSDKFQKLFYDGLVTSLGSYASDVDAVVATSEQPPEFSNHEKYGVSSIQKLSSGAPLRALFQPRLSQFQAAFDDAVAEAVDSVVASTAAGGNVLVAPLVAVVYAGEVLHSTGEWLLADSTFSGEQLQMWLDSEAAAAWQPEIQKLTSASTEPISVVVCTPNAGARTLWPMAASADGSTRLVMLSKSRRLPVRLQVTASWRANGKLASAGPTSVTSYKALHDLSADLSRMQWEHQSQLHGASTNGKTTSFVPEPLTFREEPPTLYVLPSGAGGVQTLASGLLVVHGVNVLLGSAYTNNPDGLEVPTNAPQWWDLVKGLERLDSVILPDWSASSIQSYDFFTKHLLKATTGAQGTTFWLGCLFTPPLVEPGSESPLLLSPPSSAPADSRLHRLGAEKTRLFYKIGVGELCLQYLGPAAGCLLIWQPAGGHKGDKKPAMTVLLPVTLGPEVLPAGSLLAGLVRALRKVPEIVYQEGAVGVAKKAPSVTSTGVKSRDTTQRPINAASRVTAAVKPAAQVNGTATRHTTATAAKPTAPSAKPTTASKPLSATKAPTTATTAAAPKPHPAPRTSTVPSSTLKRPTAAAAATRTTTTTKLATSAASKTPSSATPRPATAAFNRTSTTPTARPKTAPGSRPTSATAKAPVKKTAPSKTETKLAEHAAKVAAKTAAATAAAATKPGHEIKYAPAGKPSNLPPRRKVGEKTVMEELNELPEEAKAPLFVGGAGGGEVSYPDSLRGDESEMAHTTSTEMPQLPQGGRIDFDITAAGKGETVEPAHESQGTGDMPELPKTSKTPEGMYSGLPPVAGEAHGAEEIEAKPEIPGFTMDFGAPVAAKSSEAEAMRQFQEELETTKCPEVEFPVHEVEAASLLPHEELEAHETPKVAQLPPQHFHEESAKSPEAEAPPAFLHEELEAHKAPEVEPMPPQHFHEVSAASPEAEVSPQFYHEELEAHKSPEVEEMPPHDVSEELTKSPEAEVPPQSHYEEMEAQKTPEVEEQPQHFHEEEKAKSPEVEFPVHEVPAKSPEFYHEEHTSPEAEFPGHKFGAASPKVESLEAGRVAISPEIEFPVHEVASKSPEVGAAAAFHCDLEVEEPPYQFQQEEMSKSPEVEHPHFNEHLEVHKTPEVEAAPNQLHEEEMDIPVHETAARSPEVETMPQSHLEELEAHKSPEMESVPRGFHRDELSHEMEHRAAFKSPEVESMAQFNSEDLEAHESPEEMESAPPPQFLHEELSKSPEIGFGHLNTADSKSPEIESVHQVHHEALEAYKSPDMSKSPQMEFEAGSKTPECETMPQFVHDEIEGHKSAEMESVPHPPHQEEWSKSPDFGFSGQEADSKSLKEESMPQFHHDDLDVHKSLEVESAPHDFHQEELSKSPEIGFQHHDAATVSKSPEAETMPQFHHDELEAHKSPEVESAPSQFHEEELSKSPEFGLSGHEAETIPQFHQDELEAHKSSEMESAPLGFYQKVSPMSPLAGAMSEFHHDELEAHKSPELESVPHGFHHEGLSKSLLGEAMPQFHQEQELEAHESPETETVPRDFHHEETPDFPSANGMEFVAYKSPDAEQHPLHFSRSPEAEEPADLVVHHGDDGEAEGTTTTNPFMSGSLAASYGSDIDARPQTGREFTATGHQDEYPVHEVSGGEVIPEVADHVEAPETLPEVNMPPVHGDLMFQLHTSECMAQPADSTTQGSPAPPPRGIGFMDIPTGKGGEENVHSPSSEVSNDSVIHRGGEGGEVAPAPGFMPDFVVSSSTSPSTTGFSAQHPLLYNQRAMESQAGHEEEEEEGEHPHHPLHHEQQAPHGDVESSTGFQGHADEVDLPHLKSQVAPPHAGEHESNGNGEDEFTSGKGKPAADSTESAVFDPLMQWGQPQHMPAPTAPSRPSTAASARLSRPGAATRTSTMGTKAPIATTNGLRAPEALPTGPTVLLDVVWVPGCIVRVPFAMAAQFFTQVRARVYVLSGESLHPITGEAIIAGVSKWTPEEREAVLKLSGGRGVEGVNVLPTDEPLDWVRWLRRSGDGNVGTGEERLSRAGVVVRDSATLCNIHFSDSTTDLLCPGVQLRV